MARVTRMQDARVTGASSASLQKQLTEEQKRGRELQVRIHSTSGLEITIVLERGREGDLLDPCLHVDCMPMI